MSGLDDDSAVASIPLLKEFLMATPRRVAVVVGSLRKDSLNRKMAKALAAMAPASLALEIVEIGQLPLYNQDDDAAPPAAVGRRSSEQIAAADAVLFVTPEYNRSVPGVLKNAIDVGSRPYGKSAWNGKPGGGDQRLAGRDRRLRRQPSPAPVAGLPRHAGDAAARGLRRRRRRPVRRRRRLSRSRRRSSSSSKFLAAFAAWIERTAQAPA